MPICPFAEESPLPLNFPQFDIIEDAHFAPQLGQLHAFAGRQPVACATVNLRLTHPPAQRCDGDHGGH